MKKILAIIVGCLFSLPAWALRADHFKGAYPVLSHHQRDEQPQYFICDVDTVAAIWAKYGDGDLPPDLVGIKDEPSILTGFNFRRGLFFVLESGSLIGPEFMALSGSGTNRLEIRHRADGHYDLAVRIDGVTDFYELGPREPIALAFAVASPPPFRLQGSWAAEWAIAAPHGQP